MTKSETAPQSDTSEPVCQLKPCPFCGGEAQYNQILTSTKEKQLDMVWHEIECVKCGANIHDGADFETAVKEWNVRHNPAVDKKAMAEWELILKLTADEGNAVEIVHDNPDEGYNCLIIFTSLLQSPVDIGYNAKTYTGDTKLQCLQKAWNDYAGEQRLLK